MHTLLFTDLVDSTQLVQRLGDEAAAALWAEHDRRARVLLAQHHGREIDRSDGFFLLFDKVPDAAHFALEYHAAMSRMQLSARVGIHVGTVTLRENAAADVARGAKPVEVEGLAKPFAARIMALALGGQTLLSGGARNALTEAAALPAGAAIDSHGHYRLKGVDEPQEVFELGNAASTFTPPADTDKVYRVVRDGTLWRPLREVRHNLAPERDAFIGRGAELRALAHKLDHGTRLLTVLGPGGTGKTRFVCRYARAWLGDWPGGVYFCDLSEARTPDGICFALAFALGVPLAGSNPGAQLGHAIAGRGRCLVILDNFEQVVQHAKATLAVWLDSATDASFIITSRELLHLAGEEVLPLEPLALGSEAIELFTERAQAQQPQFQLTAGNGGAVADVVRLLDGLPLAIELAAARIRVLSPAQIVTRLAQRFQLLAGARGAAARQATLQSAIDWSWDLLTPWEQAALAQCSVFEGGFTLEAAEQVLQLHQWPQAPLVMDVVQSLVDKSLLRIWMRGRPDRLDLDEPYFGMYLSIREYAAGKLSGSSGSSGSARAAEQAHGQFFAAMGSDAAIDALYRHGGVKRSHSLALEIENLLAACRRALERSDGPVAVACYRAAWEVLAQRGPFASAATLGVQVLAVQSLDEPLRAAALVAAGLAHRRTGDAEQGAAYLGKALALARGLADRRREAAAHSGLGVLHYDLNELDDAEAHYAAALALYRASGDRIAEANVLGNMASLSDERGRVAAAWTYNEQALAIQRELGSRRDEGRVLGNLAGMHHECGRMQLALECYQQAMAIHREVGNLRSEGIVLGNLAIAHHDLGQLQQSLACHERAIAIHRDVGNRAFVALSLCTRGALLCELGRIDEAHGDLAQSLALCNELGARATASVALVGRSALWLHQERFAQARECIDDGLAVARQAGSRRHEGEALGRLARLHLLQGEPTQAEKHAEAALAIDLEVGAQAEEASMRGLLGEVLAMQGAFGAARQAMQEAEALQRQIGHPIGLARLLSARGRIDAAAGERGSAQAALEEARTIATQAGMGVDAPLWRDITRLQEALA